MMQVWAMTDTGLVRRQNQDAYGYVQIEQRQQTLAVVCDGMGGPKGGEIASKLAVDTFLSSVQSHLRADMAPEQIREVASFAAALANNAIRTMAAEREECHGMGTTLVSAVTYDGGVVISNVGDSRAYRITAEGIHRISKDHSFVEELVERGEITEDEARKHPKRNYITRALGAEDSLNCDGYIVALEQGDYILLCTDGLVATVTDEQMYHEITGHDPDSCMERLLEISKANGAADNVTALLLRKL